MIKTVYLFLSFFLLIFGCKDNGQDLEQGPQISISDVTTSAKAINVKSLGVKGNGSIDDRAAIQALIGSDKTLFFPKGTYKISREITLNKVSNLKISGEEGTVFTSDLDRIFLISGSIKNLEITGIKIASTRKSILNDSEGLIFIANYGANDVMDGININNCKFTNPNTQANAIKLVSEGINSLVKNISITKNKFESIGRMGIEFQNHERRTNIPRFSNYTISYNYFNDVGTIQTGSPSCCISVSGYAVDGKINYNEMVNMRMKTTSNIYYAIENAGTTRLETIGNKIHSNTYGFTGIMGSHPTPQETAINGQPYKKDWIIKDNVINLTGSNIDKNKIRGMEIANITGYTVLNNTVNSDGMGIMFVNCKNGKVEGNTVSVKSGNPFYLRLASSNNTLTANNLTSNHASYNGVVFFDGSGASGNTAYNNKLIKPGNKVGDYVNYNGAKNNTK